MTDSELYLITFFGDGAHSILVDGFDVMVETVTNEVLGEPEDREHKDIVRQRAGWEEALRDGCNWTILDRDGEEVFYHYSEQFEDGSVSVDRVMEDRTQKEAARD